VSLESCFGLFSGFLIDLHSEALPPQLAINRHYTHLTQPSIGVFAREVKRFGRKHRSLIAFHSPTETGKPDCRPIDWRK
jgi:hypothetical protein